ncbi:hypothetical protein RIF29_38653 [Crotalaria pallida]|uniref:HpcH/HpaI aldolase/citrate lyase domain-containing protein n=1 Tax=Crotalaria pallida TaxID=3830 RepID=A0AAN9HP52_CROPI
MGISTPLSLSFRTTPTTPSLSKPHSLFLSHPIFKPFSFSKSLLISSTSISSTPNTPTHPFIPKSTFTDVPSTAASATATSPSSPTNLKSRLRNGDTLYGLFLLSFSPTLAEIAGLSGYDFVVIDMEHGYGGISEALPCLHALAATNTPAIIRVPETSDSWAKKALDLGPQGIMFPMIDSAESAKKAVSYCIFPPGGVRGSAHSIVRASRYGIDEGYLANYIDELLIMCQVESLEGVKNADAIAAVDGVDCIQMGPLDLSASMGYLWDPGNKKVRDVLWEAERKVLESNEKEGDGAGAGAGAYLGGFAMPHDGPQYLRSRGYHMVSGAVDIGLFRSAAVEDVNRFKMSLVEEDRDGSDNELGEGKDGDEKYWIAGQWDCDAMTAILPPLRFAIRCASVSLSTMSKYILE